MRRRVSAKVADHFELLLTVAGVLVALGLTVAGLELGDERRAFIFLVWLQGFLLWAVRRHSRLHRQQLFARLRAMLQDRVNNQLTVMLAVAELGPKMAAASGGAPGAERMTLDRAVVAARSVSEELAHLSAESLQDWEKRYGEIRELP